MLRTDAEVVAFYKSAMGREQDEQQVIDAFLASEVQRLRVQRDEARRLVTMLLEYGTEGLDYDTLPEWARGTQW